jgi:membrane protease YdiL (CAAX protease family)
VVALVISAVVAAPVVEEMVFRGVVMRGLRSIWPIAVVLPVQGVLFGAAHVDPVRGAGNIGLVIVLSGVGVAFGVGAHLLRRIGPAIVAHAIFNGVVLVILLTGLADRINDL